MTTIRNDIRATLRQLTDDGPSGVVVLVVGIIVAVIVSFLSMAVVVAVAVGNDTSSRALLALPDALGAVFVLLAIGSAIRTTVALEDGGSSRRHGWAAVPTGMLAIGVGTLLVASFPSFALPLLFLVGWVTGFAMLDVVARGTPLGIVGAVEVVRAEPLRAIAASAVGIPVGLVASLLPLPAIIAVSVTMYVTMVACAQVYRSVHVLDAVPIDHEPAVHELTRRPSFVTPAADTRQVSLELDAVPVVSEESPVATGVNWHEVQLVVDANGSVGGWLQPNGGGRLLELYIGAERVSRALCCGPQGDWFELVRHSGSCWHAQLPVDGPWYLVVEGPTSPPCVRFRTSGVAGGGAVGEAA
jgi:hypothetical protein